MGLCRTLMPLIRDRAAIRLAALMIGHACLAVPAFAQGPLSQAERLNAVRLHFEGIGGISPSNLARVVADSASLAYYRDMLAGRVAWPRSVDTSMVMYYLVASRRPEFLPTFLTFGQVNLGPRRGTAYRVAVWGLAQLAAEPQARERLVALGQRTVPVPFRESVAHLLAIQESTAAQEILRGVYAADLPSSVQSEVRSAMVRPLAR